MKAHSQRLDACPRPHAFVALTGQKPLKKRFRCSIYSGEVGTVDRHWCERALAHGLDPKLIASLD